MIQPTGNAIIHRIIIRRSKFNVGLNIGFGNRPNFLKNKKNVFAPVYLPDLNLSMVTVSFRSQSL